MADTTSTLSPDDVQRWTRIGVLSAFAMALGYLETFIPIPIPGVKLGLANIAILIALAQGDALGAVCVGCIKVLAAGLLFGNPVTMAYSAAGTLASLLVMVPLSRLSSLRLEMLSVAGALAHELGQLAVAMLLLGTPLVWYSAPILLVAGCITGALCGIVATHTLPLLTMRQTTCHLVSTRQGDRSFVSSRATRFSDGTVRVGIVVFLVYCVVMLHASGPAQLGVGLALAAAACVAGRVEPHMLVAALRPLALILAITLVAQVATLQQGQVLATVGPLAITSEALQATATMFARLLGITAASIAVMHLAGTDQLVGAIGWLLSPFRRMGLHTEGPLLALRVALQAVPLLAQTASEQAAIWKREGLTGSFWRTTVPEFIAACYRSVS